MRITSESDYALRILASMAMHDGVTDAKTLSDETSVTQRFALKILHKLVTGGIVESYKGSRGGYKLKRGPAEITLKMVIELIDGPIAIARCVDTAENCSLNCDKTACAFHHIFDSISTDLASKLEKISISDVINGSYR
ncbi:MAG: Rrf2 family transcriptional regulator [Clostridia bacterium]|nr:Rrf2 family transcriptional regulator [Clostridia bacterium]MBR3806655.1 Rrf2 family transcriptional regulator [Clostridia bacterium]